jgi:hypothetical protein
MALKNNVPGPAKGRQRGSALLVSLMVLVGLSLIGLGYVALSETEGAIAANERNSAQTLHVAEAGAGMVVEWFQNPKWAVDKGLAPATVDAIRVVRRFTLPGGGTYTGRYKQDGTRLFERPFRNTQDRFFGTENNPDILINDKTAPDFLAALNIALFNKDVTATADDNCSGCDNAQGGRVTEIRIFAPPIDGGEINAEPGWNDPNTSGIPNGTGFYEGGTRFGLASIRVTATKFNRPDCGPYVSGCRVIAERNVKMVIAEWPFPGPQGPIQSNANIATTGNYHIHWGKITSTLDTDLKRPYVAIPWIDAYSRTPFERGYETAPGLVAAQTSNVWPTTPASADNRLNTDWFLELIDRSFEDPWYQARARGRVVQMSGTDPVNDAHQLRYDDPTMDPSGPVCNPCNAGKGEEPGQSNMFQFQTKSVQRYHTNSLFPRVDYDFWKQVAISADGQDNIYYLKHVSGDTFRDRHGNERTFRQWVDVKANPPNGTGAKSRPGFYFFDTENSMNPQNNRGGILTPKVAMSGGSMQMQGFVYLNATEFSVTGLGGYTGYYNMPGEVYRDIGYREVIDDPANPDHKEWRKQDPAGVDCTLTDASNCAPIVLANNNQHDYQDLSWSNGAANLKNKEFDVFVQQNTINPQSRAANITEYFPVSWYPGCNPGRNGAAGSPNCSEPHEPYLNFIYPAPGSPTASITVKWQAPLLQTRRRITNPNDVVPPTALPACTLASSLEDCTSNAYDKDGALVILDPILDGVFYNEGSFGSAGNANYFGSLLFERDVDAQGTPNIWFDEKLIKGAWPPGNFGFPRVYVTTHETDQ